MCSDSRNHRRTSTSNWCGASKAACSLSMTSLKNGHRIKILAVFSKFVCSFTKMILGQIYHNAVELSKNSTQTRLRDGLWHVRFHLFVLKKENLPKGLRSQHVTVEHFSSETEETWDRRRKELPRRHMRWYHSSFVVSSIPRIWSSTHQLHHMLMHRRNHVYLYYSLE